MTLPPVHTGVDEVAAHPHHTGRPWLDMVVALSAIAISLISLVVAIEHGRTEEKLVAAASWPFVVANSTIDDVIGGSGSMSLVVSNAGIGPARIQSARLLLDGHAVHSHEELLSRCCGYPTGDLEFQLRHGLVDENTVVGVLAPHDTITVLKIQRTADTTALWAKLMDLGPRLAWSACYCSVLGECWITDMESTPSR
jgi:hypothetical protein